MAVVRSIFTAIMRAVAGAWRYWMNDIQRRKTVVGKVVSVCVGLLVICCACSIPIGLVSPRRTPAGSASGPTPVQTALVSDARATTVQVDAPTATPLATAAPTDLPQPTHTPAPSNTPEATAVVQPTAPPATSTPEPTALPQPSATSVPVQAEPSRGLGMSRAAWEAKSGAPVGKGIIGEKYQNGAEATFIDNVLWRIDFAFPKSSYPTPGEAHTIGKGFIPNDATITRTYQRDVTTVNLYHSDWLAKRFSADMFTEGDPGDFTLQYNVFDGKVHSFIIALGNSP